MKSFDLYSSFRGELINVALLECLISVAIWKTWFNPVVFGIYLVTGLVLIVLLIRARKKDTPDDYVGVGKAAFAAFLLDTFICLIYLQ